MHSDPLLRDFLSDLPLTEVAERHNLSLQQLLAWADSPEIIQLFDALQRIATRRSAMIACDASAKALTNLADLSFALARRSEVPRASGEAGRPCSITALETSRKACSTLLRLHTFREPTRQPRTNPSRSAATELRALKQDSPPPTLDQAWRSVPATNELRANPARATTSTPNTYHPTPQPATTDTRAHAAAPPSTSPPSPFLPFTPSPVPLTPSTIHPFAHLSSHRLTPSPSQASRLATLAGSLSPSASRLSPLPTAGIPTG